MSKAKVTYNRQKSSGVSVKFGFQAVSKSGGAQGCVSWSDAYRMKSKQT